MAYIDVSQPIEPGMPVFPGDPSVEMRQDAAIVADGYRVTAVQCGSHTGTHIDAPRHTERGGRSIDQFPVERFVFDARVVDVTDKGAREPIELAEVPDDIDGDLLIFRTGWDEFWGTERYFDHPFLSPDVGTYCVNRGWHIALDALNPDPTPTDNATDDEPDGVPVHHTLLSNELLIVENLTNLGGIEHGTMYAFPIPLADGDGAMVRAVIETSGDRDRS